MMPLQGKKRLNRRAGALGNKCRETLC